MNKRYKIQLTAFERETLESVATALSFLPGLTAKVCEQVNEGTLFLSIRDDKGRECFSNYMEQIEDGKK